MLFLETRGILGNNKENGAHHKVSILKLGHLTDSYRTLLIVYDV